MARRRVLHGLSFFPRGGSAQVVRALARALPAHGWDVTVLAGSYPPDAAAEDFFGGLDLHAVDYSAAAAAAADPLAHLPPFHPSYEDREDAPDRVFARLDDELYEHHVDFWADTLARAGAAEADVLHLHHLTPMYEAARRVAPGVPVVGHLHGTELLMLEEIADGPPPGWEHARAWGERMTRWAHGCARVVLLSATQEDRAEALLGLDPRECTVLPNGFDPESFRPAPRTPAERAMFWREQLVEHPRGWRPGERAGSVAYTEADIAPLTAGGTVVLYVGRFTKVKRISLLIRAWSRARKNTDPAAGPAALVLVGGHPGEWEGEHPLEAIAQSGAPDVLLAGWHGQEELPAFLNAADATVLASVREQFGQVVVEGMACGLPAVAVAAYGPGEIIADGETGWLVPPDDEEALATALSAVLTDPEERRRRGGNAAREAAARYGWPAIAGRLAELYEDLTA